ncbi:hypothetical protein EVAR_53988_1 [Eumeta japonica]|uniref:Uncharacterized protein n=1 Tax=Eumeta variegata TaxID=151549 RepID=A0A4C1YT95_EUMVA|nr:hypothetical protein EVAR_53988_1 [Eumeta japonica]
MAALRIAIESEGELAKSSVPDLVLTTSDSNRHAHRVTFEIMKAEPYLSGILNYPEKVCLIVTIHPIPTALFTIQRHILKCADESATHAPAAASKRAHELPVPEPEAYVLTKKHPDAFTAFVTTVVISCAYATEQRDGFKVKAPPVLPFWIRSEIQFLDYSTRPCDRQQQKMYDKTYHLGRVFYSYLEEPTYQVVAARKCDGTVRYRSLREYRREETASIVSFRQVSKISDGSLSPPSLASFHQISYIYQKRPARPGDFSGFASVDGDDHLFLIAGKLIFPSDTH